MSMSAIRISGLLFLAAAIATAVSVMTRLASSDEPLAGSPIQLPIILDTGLYVVAGAARVLSGLALLGAAAWLWLALRARQPLAVGIAATLLALSGLVTAVSGASMLALAGGIPQAADGSATLVAWGVPGWVESADVIRWFAGKLGFMLAGLGLIALGPVQWRMGGILRASAIADVIIGVAMVFIWVDAATVMHRVSGVAFLVWLIVMGVWLTLGLLKSSQPATATTT